MRNGLLLYLLAIPQIACQEKQSAEPPSMEAQLSKAGAMVQATIPNALTAYYRKNRSFPDRLDMLVQAQMLQYEQLVDPWNTQFSYEPGTTEFRICSAGPDKHFGTRDDICNE